VNNSRGEFASLWCKEELPIFLSAGKHGVAQGVELQIARMCKSVHFRKWAAATDVLCQTTMRNG
jgi:hypothetical protein